MAEAAEVFERARAAFRKAADAETIEGMRMHVALGLALLEHADTLSGLIEIAPVRKTRPS